MRVCFLANFGKTLFYDGIARVLQARGHEILWVTPSSRWNASIGAPSDKVLDLSAFEREWTGPGDLAPVAEAELAKLELAQNLTVNDMIVIDRALRELPASQARRYLAMVDRETRTFFERGAPDLVLGEATWGWELMVGARAREMGAGQYCFSSVRFPSDRVAFSDGLRDETLFPVRDALPTDREEAERLVDAFRARPTRPAYEALNSKLPTVRPHWVDEARALVTGRERGNPSARSLKARVGSRGAMLRNVIAQRMASPFEALPPEPRKPFLLVLLHIQPESTIDAYASYHADQIDNVAMLSRSLPATHEIYVKEHPSVRGDRSPDYYARLKAIPGVRLIPPQADTFTLMKEAWLTVSAAGSACYEAGLLGAPAATMTPLFYSPLLVAPFIAPKTQSVQSLRALVDSYNAVPPELRREKAIGLVADVLRCSLKAVVSDPATHPPCLEPDNLELLADGIEGLQAQLRRGGPQPTRPLADSDRRFRNLALAPS